MKFRKLMKFGKDESGATAIEYGLITALIAIAVIGAVGAVGNALNSNYFNEIDGKLQGVNTTP